MGKPLPSLRALQHQLELARTTVILAEDSGDWTLAEEARHLCDDLLDLINEIHPHVDV